MDKGCIEIGNIITRASAEVIGKLRSILDRHAIFYVCDGIEFNPPSGQAVCKTYIHRGRFATADNQQDNIYLKTRGLIVPDFYELNFMSFINFNSDEADFVSTLIYGEHREN